jgi:hypothetical protein
VDTGARLTAAAAALAGRGVDVRGAVVVSIEVEDVSVGGASGGNPAATAGSWFCETGGNFSGGWRKASISTSSLDAASASNAIR